MPAPKHSCTSPETGPCYHYVVGTLASIDSATIVVRLQNGETETVSRARATPLDVSASGGACGARCIGLGFVAGAVVATLVTSEFAHNCRGEYCGLNYLPIPPAGAILGIVVGGPARV